MSLHTVRLTCLLTLPLGSDIDDYMVCDYCGTTQRAPFPTKQVLLDFRLSLPQTITDLVVRLASKVNVGKSGKLLFFSSADLQYTSESPGGR